MERAFKRESKEYKEIDKALFLEALTPEQLVSFKTQHEVIVTTNLGRKYRIRCTYNDGYPYMQNLEWVDDSGNTFGTFTAYPYRTGGNVVTRYGAWLVQLLQLQRDERGLIGLACVSRGRKPLDYIGWYGPGVLGEGSRAGYYTGQGIWTGSTKPALELYPPITTTPLGPWQER